MYSEQVTSLQVAAMTRHNPNDSELVYLRLEAIALLEDRVALLQPSRNSTKGN